MKASQMLELLQDLVEEHGDLDVMVWEGDTFGHVTEEAVDRVVYAVNSDETGAWFMVEAS